MVFDYGPRSLIGVLFWDALDSCRGKIPEFNATNATRIEQAEMPVF
jgi:hypothetical protein